MNPKSTTPVDLAFGPKKIDDYLPIDVPDHYKDMSRPSVFMICVWYYHQQPIRLVPNNKIALNHITACIRCNGISDDRKILGCAYLLDQFFRMAIWENTKYQLGVTE